MIHHIFDKTGGVILTAVFCILFFLESRYKLRRRIQDRWKRIVTNLIVAAPSFALLRLLLIPVMVGLAVESRRIGFGLNYHYWLPDFLKIAVTILLLDYSNFIWHILLHKVPFLWRFHLVHHTDLDLDITTAFRFHFGELVASVLFRGGVVFLLGVTPWLVLVYEIVFEAATQFQHSNWKIPVRIERLVGRLLVTPRMHGIHHSRIKSETDSNFSIVFSFWDRVHRTIRLNVHHKDVEIGVPSYTDEKELTEITLLKLPFTRIRSWDDDFLDRDVSKGNKGDLYY